MFNFYVVWPGLDMVIDAGRATTRRLKFKAPSVQKMKDRPKTWVLTGKQFEEFRPEKLNCSSLGMENKTKETQDPKGKN